MIIDTFKTEKFEERIKVSAKIKWEECNRPTQEVFFETNIEFASDFSCNPHAFLIGCVLPAMRLGEKLLMIQPNQHSHRRQKYNRRKQIKHQHTFNMAL